jgi:hypothetical protein
MIAEREVGSVRATIPPVEAAILDRRDDESPIGSPKERMPESSRSVMVERLTDPVSTEAHPGSTYAGRGYRDIKEPGIVRGSHVLPTLPLASDTPVFSDTHHSRRTSWTHFSFLWPPPSSSSPSQSVIHSVTTAHNRALCRSRCRPAPSVRWPRWTTARLGVGHDQRAWRSQSSELRSRA